MIKIYLQSQTSRPPCYVVTKQFANDRVPRNALYWSMIVTVRLRVTTHVVIACRAWFDQLWKFDRLCATCLVSTVSESGEYCE